METKIFYVVSSGNTNYTRLAYHIEDAKIYASRMAQEFGGAEITECQIVKDSFKQLFYVKPTVEFVSKEIKESAEA